jgi:CRISPR-associated protein Csb2
VLEHIDGEMPDIRAAALVAKEIRDTILSGYSSRGMEDRIPYIVSGHNRDGSPAREPHLAIVPLAYAGSSRYADGHVLGFALVPPRKSGLLKDADFLQAIRAVAKYDQGRRSMRFDNTGLVRLRRFGLTLSPTLEPERISLDSGRYTQPAPCFATVTPIVLDRHLKERGEEREQEIGNQIKAACRNIGLPEPSLVVPDKHSAIEGAPSAQPSGRSPAWMRWQLPASLNNRFLTHAVLCFSEPVQGPVILGAGRFVGMGLCLPIETKEEDER